MTIVEALKNPDLDMRVDFGDRWLLWNEDANEWTVYERKKFARHTTTIHRCKNEDEAVAALITQ